MKTRLLNLWESLRTSFWFIPGLLTLSAIAFSFITVTLDKSIELDPAHATGFLYSGSAEGARSTLSTIAASMITVAGVVFSITIVAMTLASSQFGPRLLRNFMQDTVNQVVLGTFLATFIYCLLVLRTVHTGTDLYFVPAMSVTFAIVLALTSVMILIYFIHHVSTSIQADRVIASVYGELYEHSAILFPDDADAAAGNMSNREDQTNPGESDYRHTGEVLANSDGYLQAVANNKLMEIAGRNNCIIFLECRPGDLVVTGNPLASFHYNEIVDENTDEQIRSAFIVGAQRTSEQDIESVINQLVEIAVRALSPGINDPFTAMACIDHLGSFLCHLAGKTFPSTCHYDDDGKLRLVSRPVTFTRLTNIAFDQIRQYGRSSVAVTIRLLDMLNVIAAHARTSEQREAILRQANMIIEAAHHSLEEENDRQDAQERFDALLATLDKYQ